jgi:phage gpG-like protein
MIRILANVKGDLRAYKALIREALKKGMLRVVLEQQQYTIAEKLSAEEGYSPDQLHHRTGHLQRSLVYAVEDTTDGVTGMVGFTQEGWYGKIHEYGGTFTRTYKNARPYGAGTYTMTIPARAPLRTALHEREDRIRELLAEAVFEALK